MYTQTMECRWGEKDAVNIIDSWDPAGNKCPKEEEGTDIIFIQQLFLDYYSMKSMMLANWGGAK